MRKIVTSIVAATIIVSVTTIAYKAQSVFAAAAYPYAVGGTGTTTPNIGQVTYWGTSNLKGIATTSATCSGGASCSAFTVLGSTPVIITTSGSSGTVSTSSSETSGRVPFWTSNSATPALLSGGSSNFTWDNTNNILSALHFSATGSSTLQAFTATNSTTTNATSTNEFATVASSTSLFTTAATVGTFNGANLSTCNGSNFLQWSSGLFACGTPSGGSTFGKTWEIVSGWLTPTTTIGVNLQSTGTTYGLGIENKLLGYASSTNSSTIFGLNAGGQIATTSTPAATAATAFGYRALRSNIGLSATAVGAFALDTGGSALSGIGNTAVGYGAGSGINYGYLTALGLFAAGGTSGTATSTGTTAIGAFAGNLMDTRSDYNTLVGYGAGRNITNGYGNVLLGPSITNSTITTGSNNIGIGYNVFYPSGTANNQLNIGGLLFGTLPATTTAWTLPTTGGIGIGSSSPYALLSIHANGGNTNTTLFAVGSSTASATTTLFTIDNTGTASTTKLNIGQSTIDVASTSISTPTGNIFSVNSKGGIFASSTLSYMGSFGASGTTTIGLPLDIHKQTIRSIRCYTDQGTAWVGFGTGSATTTENQCSSTPSSVSISSNNVFNGSQIIYIEIGRSASSPNRITVSADVEESN